MMTNSPQPGTLQERAGGPGAVRDGRRGVGGAVPLAHPEGFPQHPRPEMVEPSTAYDAKDS